MSTESTPQELTQVGRRWPLYAEVGTGHQKINFVVWSPQITPVKWYNSSSSITKISANFRGVFQKLVCPSGPNDIFTGEPWMFVKEKSTQKTNYRTAILRRRYGTVLQNKHWDKKILRHWPFKTALWEGMIWQFCFLLPTIYAMPDGVKRVMGLRKWV